MKILAIETSCDETGVAIVEGAKIGDTTFEFETLGAALLSQAALHAPYGGVYPNLAKREHLKNLPIILEQALESAGLPFGDENSLAGYAPRTFSVAKGRPAIDAIAVTVGPGLEPALWTGIEFAKKLSQEWDVPLIPVNHMEGHLISSLASPKPLTKAGLRLAEAGYGHAKAGLAQKEHSHILQNVRMTIEGVQLPVLGLLISGGHTEFVLMKEWFQYEIVGETLDDAVGEAFDKVARMLELPYPGGPEISKLADEAREKKNQHSEGLRSATGARTEQFSSKKIAYSENLGFSVKPPPPAVFSPPKLPRPMLQSGTCDMSFSGLKTAALYAIREITKERPLTEQDKIAFAAEFEEAVADVFISKTRRALEDSRAHTFVIGGGVAANRYIRERLQILVLEEFPGVELRLPDPAITGDNAVMIAQAALARALSGVQEKSADDIRAVGNLSLAA